MPIQNNEIFTGVIIESDSPLSLEELCQAVQLHDTVIRQMVQYHLLEPAGGSPAEWMFDNLCLRRARLAASFYHDLEINIPGIGLALDLLERIESLETELNKLQQLK